VERWRKFGEEISRIGKHFFFRLSRKLEDLLRMISAEGGTSIQWLLADTSADVWSSYGENGYPRYDKVGIG